MIRRKTKKIQSKASQTGSFINNIPKVGETAVNDTSSNNIGGGDPATGSADATAVTNKNVQKESGSTVPKEVPPEGNEETKETDDKGALDDSCHTLDSLFRDDYYDVPGGRQQ